MPATAVSRIVSANTWPGGRALASGDGLITSLAIQVGAVNTVDAFSFTIPLQ